MEGLRMALHDLRRLARLAPARTPARAFERLAVIQAAADAAVLRDRVPATGAEALERPPSHLRRPPRFGAGGAAAAAYPRAHTHRNRSMNRPLAASSRPAAARAPAPAPAAAPAAAPAKRRLSQAQSAFLASLALQLGLPASEAPHLVAPRHFVGPSGLACLVELHPEQPAVRVLTLLPMSPAEFIGPEVDLLLAVQGELLSSLGWYLGSSADGLLQLDSLKWIDDPVEAATALDLANGIGVAVLRTLLHADALSDRRPSREPLP
jgi:hypothetical protein